MLNKWWQNTVQMASCQRCAMSRYLQKETSARQINRQSSETSRFQHRVTYSAEPQTSPFLTPFSSKCHLFIYVIELENIFSAPHLRVERLILHTATMCLSWEAIENSHPHKLPKSYCFTRNKSSLDWKKKKKGIIWGVFFRNSYMI